MFRRYAIAFASALLLATPSLAAPAEWIEKEAAFSAKLDLKPLRMLPVQEGGRRKPIDSFAREKVHKLTGRKRFQGIEPTFMILSIAYEPQLWASRRILDVHHLELIKMFTDEGDYSEQRRKPGQRLFVSERDFRDNAAVQRVFDKARRKQSKKRATDELEQAVLELGEKIFIQRSVGPMLCVVPVSDNVEDKWTTISGAEAALFGDLQKTEATLVHGLRARDASAVNAEAKALATQMQAYDFKVYPYFGLLELEYSLNSWRPMTIAQILYLLATLCLVTGLFGYGGARKAGFALFCVAIGVHVLALTGRGFLVSRAPVASLYETLIFMIGFAAVMALALEVVFKGEGNFALAGAIVGFAGLFLGDSVPIYADKQAISPLVPVLRSYWLNIHVTCMIASYGACLLSFMMSSVYLFKWCLRGADSAQQEDMVRLDTYVYRCVQVAFLLLTIGIILGGVWANQSWGRYWDWDPKETWAFITWIVYAAYLHLRLIGVAKGPVASLLNFGGFWCMMFTYLGVSYVLPGLHSYVENGNADYTAMVIYFTVFPGAYVGIFGVTWIVGKSLRGGAGASPEKAELPAKADAKATAQVEAKSST